MGLEQEAMEGARQQVAAYRNECISSQEVIADTKIRE